MMFRQPAGPERRPVAAFRASFDGDCESCYGTIYEGDMIGFLPGDVRPSCEDCVDDHNEELQ